MTEQRRSFIYFVQSTARDGLIKIGTSFDVTKRVALLKRNSGVELEFLLVIRGAREGERELHQRFRKHRTIGEWFLPDPEILTFVELAKLDGLSVPVQSLFTYERAGAIQEISPTPPVPALPLGFVACTLVTGCAVGECSAEIGGERVHDDAEVSE